MSEKILPELSDEEFVKRAYSVILHREVDNDTYYYWVEKIKNESDKDFYRNDLIHRLLESSERKIKKIYLSKEEVIEKMQYGSFASSRKVLSCQENEFSKRKKIGMIISHIGHSGEDQVLCMLADYLIEHNYDVCIFYQKGNKIYDCKAHFINISDVKDIPLDCFMYIGSSHEASADILNKLSVSKNRKVFYVQSYMQHIKKKQIYNYPMIKVAASKWIKQQINADYLIEPCFNKIFISRKKYDVFCLNREEKEGNSIALNICKDLNKEGYSIKILKYPDEFVPPDEMKKIYSDSLIFLYTFKNDCFPLMPFEAYNHGCRVISTPGNPGMGVYRDFVDFVDEKTIKERITSFIDNVRNLENHNIEKMGNKFLNLFKKTFYFKMLIIVDVYNWAWDIASKELLQSMSDVDGQIMDVKDFKQKNINSDDFDVVLVYPWYDKEIMKKLSPSNTIVCVAGGDVIGNSFTPLLKSVLSDFIVFGAVNKKIQKHLLGMINVDSGKKIIILLHGTDTDTFKPKINTSHDFVIGWAGNCDRSLKRFDLAKKIASELGVRLKVANQTLDGNQIPHNQMNDFYNSINCLLVTSETEAHPLVIYEAMACGIPVVTTDVGDVDETISHGYNGFILPVDAPLSDFVESIKKLMSETHGSNSIAYEMGKNARNTIVEHWTWDKIVLQYKNLNNVLENAVQDFLLKNKKRIIWQSLRFKEVVDG